jgi:L-amino acid N-acyltransferase
MTSRPRRRTRAAEGIVIRDARERDLPALLEIYNDAIATLPATFDLETQTLRQRSRWFSEHGERHPLIVAESQGRILGYACLSGFRDKPGYSKSVEDSVYVHKDARGKGWGRYC